MPCAVAKLAGMPLPMRLQQLVLLECIQQHKQKQANILGA